MRRLARTLCCLLTGLAAAQAGGADAAPPAGGLRDPTRPPFGAANAGGKAAAGPQLQSVLISPARKVAVIDGRTVPLGAKFRGATLTRITESGVELRKAGRVEVLKLFPRVEKKPRRRN